MNKSTHFVTADGLAKAKKELVERLAKKDDLKLVLESARAAGDLRENDGYTLALEDFKNNDIEIANLQDLISNAKVVKNKVKDKVEIGDQVRVKDENGKELLFKLVGENEYNPLENKITYNSPLGKSILGKDKGDSFKFKTPRGEVSYTIVEVLD